MSWARAVKSRRRIQIPVVWLFTDAIRAPDVLGAVRALPPGCGVVFRHDGVPGRCGLARAVLTLCREGRHQMVMTAPAIAGTGLHIRGGHRPHARRLPAFVTSSAHCRLDVMRARRIGADVIFLSPVFATASHVGLPGMGRLRWSRAGCGLGGLFALGGVTGRTVRALPSRCVGFGAIGALTDCVPSATVFHDCHSRVPVTVANGGLARQ